LQEGDRDAKLDAVKVLRDAGTVDAVRALSLAIRDKNPRVKHEAVSALKALGDEIIVKETPADRTDTEDDSDDDTSSSGRRNNSDDEEEANNDDEEEANNDEEEEPTQRGTAFLSMGSISEDGASVELTNDVPVGSVQFSLNGVQPTQVRTTARSEGFVASFHGGKVTLIALSGRTIAPGSGPILEVVGNNSGSVQLSGAMCANEKGYAIK